MYIYILRFHIKYIYCCSLYLYISLKTNVIIQNKLHYFKKINLYTLVTLLYKVIHIFNFYMLLLYGA